MTNHKHRWRRSCYSAKEITFRCNKGKCQERKTRPTTKREEANIILKCKKDSLDTKEMFKVWNEYVLEISNKYPDGGWNLMQASEEWAKKYPKQVKFIYMDDDHHASSQIMFVTHKKKRKLWGVSAVVMPQNGRPCEFFMYPQSIKQMYKLITKLNKIPVHKSVDY